MSSTALVPAEWMARLEAALQAVDNARHSLDREHAQAKLVEVVREVVK